MTINHIALVLVGNSVRLITGFLFPPRISSQEPTVRVTCTTFQVAKMSDREELSDNCMHDVTTAAQEEDNLSEMTIRLSASSKTHDCRRLAQLRQGATPEHFTFRCLHLRHLYWIPQVDFVSGVLLKGICTYALVVLHRAAESPFTARFDIPL
jgi:hypothetical protein